MIGPNSFCNASILKNIRRTDRKLKSKWITRTFYVLWFRKLWRSTPYHYEFTYYERILRTIFVASHSRTAVLVVLTTTRRIGSLIRASLAFYAIPLRLTFRKQKNRYTSTEIRNRFFWDLFFIRNTILFIYLFVVRRKCLHSIQEDWFFWHAWWSPWLVALLLVCLLRQQIPPFVQLETTHAAILFLAFQQRNLPENRLLPALSIISAEGNCTSPKHSQTSTRWSFEPEAQGSWLSLTLQRRKCDSEFHQSKANGYSGQASSCLSSWMFLIDFSLLLLQTFI